MIRQRRKIALAKLDPTVKRETKYITLFVLIFSVILESVFLIIGKWDHTILFGNLLGGFVASLNFLLLGITLQKALGHDEKEAKSMMKASQSMRMFMLVVTAGVGYFAPVFNLIAVLAPLFFPRIAIMLRTFIDRKKEKRGKGSE